MPETVEQRLAKAEALPIQDDERPFFDKLMESLSEEDRQRAEADPLDVLIIVRGFADEEKRMEATVEAMQKICEWRAKTGYYEFFNRRLDGADDFHKWWPETIHGCDKYGHFLQCLRAGQVDADSLEKVRRMRRAGLRVAVCRHDVGQCSISHVRLCCLSLCRASCYPEVGVVAGHMVGPVFPCRRMLSGRFASFASFTCTPVRTGVRAGVYWGAVQGLSNLCYLRTGSPQKDSHNPPQRGANTQSPAPKGHTRNLGL